MCILGQTLISKSQLLGSSALLQPSSWMPNLMFLSCTGSFLISKRLIFSLICGPVYFVFCVQIDCVPLSSLQLGTDQQHNVFLMCFPIGWSYSLDILMLLYSMIHNGIIDIQAAYNFQPTPNFETLANLNYYKMLTNTYTYIREVQIDVYLNVIV